jgi:BatD DUF11 like domain
MKIAVSYILPAFFVLSMPILQGQEASVDWRVEVSDTIVAVGEPFKISLVADNARNARFPEPDWQKIGLRVLNTSQSSSVSISEGEYQSSTTSTYIVSAPQIGLYQLPSLQLQYKGQTYTTQRVDIQVTEEGDGDKVTPHQKPRIKDDAPPASRPKPQKRLNTIRI